LHTWFGLSVNLECRSETCCHLYSAGRPSSWALAHILVVFILIPAYTPQYTPGVSLSPGHIVLDGDPAPPRKGAQQPSLSQFKGTGFACIRIIRGPCLLWLNGWMDQDPILYRGRPRPRPHYVRWGPSSRQRGTAATIFGPCLLWPNGWIDLDVT